MAKTAKIQVRPSRMATPVAPRSCWVTVNESDLFSLRSDMPRIWRSTSAKARKLMIRMRQTGATKAP